jgi:hypothetical protein
MMRWGACTGFGSCGENNHKFSCHCIEAFARPARMLDVNFSTGVVLVGQGFEKHDHMNGCTEKGPSFCDLTQLNKTLFEE